jgi:hypothetical protein
MAKANLQGVPRPARAFETREFPLSTGETLVLSLRVADRFDALRISAKAQELVESLHGNYFPLANGEAVPVELGVANVICALEVMQPETVEDPYSAADFLGLLVNFPHTWDEVSAWATDLQAGANTEQAEKN